MVPFRHAPVLRQCLAALLALGLLLNGMGGSLAANAGRARAATIVIAGTLVTLCQLGGGDSGDKAHGGHSCDQCALRLAPTLPEGNGAAAAIRYPQPLTVRALRLLSTPDRQTARPAWPRGPPVA